MKLLQLRSVRGRVPVCSPEFGVDLQGLGQHLGPHVSHGVSTDVQFGEGGVAAQSVQDDGEVSLQLGIGQREGGQRLRGVGGWGGPIQLIETL